ncbi:MAG TPA: response regulator [Cyclobacteriaceae bacterium]|nr:response regulator [Cyclobacteriaceae bacterium]
MEKAHILVVEDQMVVAKSIAAMVVGHGMEVIRICTSGEEAVEFVEKQVPDIVLMDIKLQGKMDGIQTAAAIRKMYKIPVIYLSDYSDKVTVRKAKATRPANFLSKPFTEADLLRAIDIAIYNANASRAVEGGDDDGFVFLKTGPQTYSRLEYSNIIYLEADRAYCKIQSVDRVHSVSMSMASVAEQLNPATFLKIHRSYVVNIRKVRELAGSEVSIAKYKLPVSDQHRAELMARLKVLH